ncbi:MAG: cellulase family glycosylhydrolase [Bacteroidales bacterium]|nr:cellulase family glycosylhydrolase [Bacteroidales bacterium]MCB9013527.1 cellulase family glycosylhydrolase [Bacteroidales bacterium]
MEDSIIKWPVWIKRKPVFKGAAIIILFAFLFSCSEKTDNKPEISFLHTNGIYMLNEANDTILLRGVGLGNWLLPEGYMWKFGRNGDRPRKIEKLILELTDSAYASDFWKSFRHDFVTEADIKKIAELGFNSVRPALNARVFLTEGDTAVFIEENFSLLDSLVSWCGKYGVYVILDMHAAPGGQTGQNIDDSPNDLPELFMDPIYENRLIRLWVKLADRYKDSPAVAGYDLLNEPLPDRTGAAEKYKYMLEPMYKKITAAIREVDKKHMIILEGSNWANDWSVFTKPFDDNLVYQFHYYCWNQPEKLNSINYFLKMRDSLNAPVWVGETGEKNAQIYWATTQLFEKNNIGWSFWTWKKLDNNKGLYSMALPNDWRKISRYSRGREKDSLENAKAILDEFLNNIKLENCTLITDASQSMFRRIPGKVRAVNYGHNAYMNSYFVNDTSYRAEYYREAEPVKTGMIEYDSIEYSARYYIELSQGEWTSYNINSPEHNIFNCEIKIQSVDETSNAELSLNGRNWEIGFTDQNWNTLKLEGFDFKKGENTLKIKVSSGNIKLEGFEFTYSEQ